MGLQRLIEVCRKIVKRNPGEVLVDLARNARLCCLSQEASQLAEGLRRGDQHQTVEGVVLGASIQDFRHLLREEVFFERMPVGARRHRMAASVTDAFLGLARLVRAQLPGGQATLDVRRFQDRLERRRRSKPRFFAAFVARAVPFGGGGSGGFCA